jgi:hypothetical protein
MLPFDPPLIQSNAAVTNVIPVRWDVITAPTTTVTQYTLSFRHTPFGGSTGAWTQVPVNPPTAVSINFDYAALGLGNGIYEFVVQATNNFNQTQPFAQASTLSASVVLDLDDTIQPRLYMPIVANQIVD